MATLWATMFAADAVTIKGRIDELADTVCARDPRTTLQRRTDAMAPASLGADRIACLCGSEDCLASLQPPASAVVIHLVAHDDTITPPPEAPTPPHEPTPTHGDGDGEPDGDVEAEAAEPESTVDGAETPCSEPESAQPDAQPDARIRKPLYTRPKPGSATNQYAALDGEHPPLLSRPLREMTLTEVMAECSADPGEHPATTPAIIIGGPVLPGAFAQRAAIGAKIVPIIHPGDAPPEPRYTPSKALADFVRARDLTCRFPGCRVPSTTCDVDHVIPYPHGPTQAANLNCKCRLHHLFKTFWYHLLGWTEHQTRDGTVTFTLPEGTTYTTHPGSRRLFPSLCHPTAPVDLTGRPPLPPPGTGLTMPRRAVTRQAARHTRIDAERHLNQLDPDHPANHVTTNEPKNTEPPWATTKGPQDDDTGEGGDTHPVLDTGS